MFLLSNTSLAVNNGEEKKAETVTSTESANNTEEEKKAEEPIEEESDKEPAAKENSESGTIYLGYKPDSTNLNSVNKFNFIFYFIYKLKYDEDPNNAGQIHYEF